MLKSLLQENKNKMLASNLVLKARYRSHLRVSSPSFFPLNVASESGLFCWLVLKKEIAEGKLLSIFLCKKQFCKQFYRTENFKYLSTFLLCQYKHSTYKSGFRYHCIFLSFPVWRESAALYLVKKLHWKNCFAISTIFARFLRTHLHILEQSSDTETEPEIIPLVWTWKSSHSWKALNSLLVLKPNMP